MACIYSSIPHAASAYIAGLYKWKCYTISLATLLPITLHIIRHPNMATNQLKDH